MIGYQEFRAIKADLLKSKPLRMDCMNTQKALGAFIPTFKNENNDQGRAYKLIADHYGFNLSYSFHQGAGIREVIKDLADSHVLKSSTFLLPEDVYPVYFELIRDRTIVTFKTLPTLDLTRTFSMAPSAKVLLLPMPLVPSGEDLSEKEFQVLMSWLALDQNHLIIIDSAYSFNRNSSSFESLLGTGQCVLLLSLAKTWLSPSLLGMAVAEKKLLNKFNLPRHQISNHWESIVCSAPNLPRVLQANFDREWQSLYNALSEIDLHWSPPKNGYFKIVPVDYLTLLTKYNVLGVPASVFGSRQANITVVSCLYETQKSLLERKV
jgi:histidinol-phosphate/aromatic aminotransferase/cobyric acid decarboxylase-like protein